MKSNAASGNSQRNDRQMISGGDRFENWKPVVKIPDSLEARLYESQHASMTERSGRIGMLDR
jgi:hypothetical protein